MESSVLLEPVSQREQASQPEPALQREWVLLPEEEQWASAPVWALGELLRVAALPVSLVADGRQAVMVGDAGQARALAQVQPGEPEWVRGVQPLEPVVDDLAGRSGYSVPDCSDEHWQQPVVAAPRRGQELPGRRVCSQRWVELPQTRPVCRDWRMRTAGDSGKPLAGAVPALPWEECAVRGRRRPQWVAAGELRLQVRCN